MPGLLEINHVWTSSGASGGLTAVRVLGWPSQSVMYCQNSTLASTQSWRIETAQESTGPWFNEGSTSISTAATLQTAIRFTGPYQYVRPYVQSASTGDYQFRLIGVS